MTYMPESGGKMSSKSKQLLSTAMKRTTEWIFSQEIPSDITVRTGGASFTLHKFPLLSKCGYIRKLVSESSESELSSIDLPDVPGGSEGFELAAKFCYGINFEIGTDNIAMLRCVAEYLEMTEDYAVANLVGRTEEYINEVSLKSLSGAITILHAAESLKPISEKVKLFGRCIDVIACAACSDGEFSRSGRVVEGNRAIVPSPGSQPKTIIEWWAEDLTVLRIDVFQRVIIAMQARGLKPYAIGPILMLYAQKSLRGLDVLGKGRKKIEPQTEQEKRVVLEMIVSLLPREKDAVPVSFLSTLLRAAKFLETTVACQFGLEKRIGLQLGQAILDNLLFPSSAFPGDTLFDVDTVQRIMTNYIECEMEGKHSRDDANGEYSSAPPSDMERVGKLMENYLAEIASDRNLSVAKFINIAELVPEKSRATEDGIYRAVDIYLKAHPSVSDTERKKICNLMECQKLSSEACGHAAQNERLPVQTIVQVLYYEQQRLREAMNGSHGGEREVPPLTSKSNVYTDDFSSLRRENEDLKIEIVKMKLKMREIERMTTHGSAAESPSEGSSADKPSQRRKSFVNSVAKKLGKLYSFAGLVSIPKAAKTKPVKERRHSIS